MKRQTRSKIAIDTQKKESLSSHPKPGIQIQTENTTGYYFFNESIHELYYHSRYLHLVFLLTNSVVPNLFENVQQNQQSEYTHQNRARKTTIQMLAMQPAVQICIWFEETFEYP